MKLFTAMVLAASLAAAPAHAQGGAAPDIILVGGKVVTMDGSDSIAESVAIRGDRIVAVGATEDVRKLAGSTTQLIDLGGSTVVPGLIDNHIHAIRDGLKYNQMVEWGDMTNLADALASLRDAARRAPPGGWIIVAGAWDRHQFPEKRWPTPAELDAISADHPIYVQHQFDVAVLNKLAWQKLNVSQEALTAQSPRQPLEIETGADGKPTGVIFGRGRGNSLVQLLAPAFRREFEEQVEGTKLFFHRLNSLGLTGIIDHGDLNREQYRPLFSLWQRGGLTLRVRYNLFAIPRLPDRPGTPAEELSQVQEMTQFLPPRGGDDWLRFLGFGEKMVAGLIDGYMNSDPPLPLAADGPERGYAFAKWAAANGYTLSVHASHEATADTILDVFERVNREHPIAPLRWRIEHGEDLSDASLRRMKALGVFYAVQDRLHYGGDEFVRLRGAKVAAASPPIREALDLGIVVTGGTDGPVIAPPNPFISLAWMVTGKTASGKLTRPADRLPTRMEALRAYTANAAWASFEEDERGTLEPGKLADLVVLTEDYLTVPEDRIGGIAARITMVGGKIVYRRE